MSSKRHCRGYLAQVMNEPVFSFTFSVDEDVLKYSRSEPFPVFQDDQVTVEVDSEGLVVEYHYDMDYPLRIIVTHMDHEQKQRFIMQDSPERLEELILQPDETYQVHIEHVQPRVICE